ncbi:cohesin [Solibacillus silvestris]|uniref:cohesin n=1 Tax=Solibacillus silvestris TaxID=76853 RepID=UPI0008708637|nr:cohesin [Solibacillus silvestris]
MITLSNKNNKENKQASNDQSKLGTLYEIAKEFSPILSTDAKSKIEEIAKEFLPADQANRMSNAFASMKSQPKSQEEIAKEFLPANDQTNRMSNAFAPLKSQQKSLEEIAKEFLPTKDKTFKHDNGANFDK